MFCENCGRPVPDGAAFCPGCGAPAGTAERLPEGICQGEDGKYRWYYEVDLKHNFSILYSFLSLGLVLSGAVLVLLLVMQVVSLGPLEGAAAVLPALVIVPAVLLGLMLLCYLVLILLYGGRYEVFFTMDEERIVHSVAKRQADRALMLSLISARLTGDMSNAVMPLLGQSFVSEYSRVKRLKARPRRDLIRLNGLFIKNQIYCTPEQFEFVYDFLSRHCTGAGKK